MKTKIGSASYFGDYIFFFQLFLFIYFFWPLVVDTYYFGMQYLSFLIRENCFSVQRQMFGSQQCAAIANIFF